MSISVNTENPDNNVGAAGSIFYDANCSLCRRGVNLLGRLFARRGFRWVPLQTDGAAERLRVSEADLRKEMRLLLPDGRSLAGVDAWIELFRSVWWLRLVAMALRLPGIHGIAGRAYAWIARHRYCLGGACDASNPERTHRRHRAFLEPP